MPRQMSQQARQEASLLTRGCAYYRSLRGGDYDAQEWKRLARSTKLAYGRHKAGTASHQEQSLINMRETEYNWKKKAEAISRAHDDAEQVPDEDKYILEEFRLDAEERKATNLEYHPKLEYVSYFHFPYRFMKQDFPELAASHRKRWTPAKWLGRGGYGAAGVWVAVDPREGEEESGRGDGEEQSDDDDAEKLEGKTIVDIVVLKESRLQPFMWRDPFFKVHGLPAEIAVLNLLSYKPSPCIIRLEDAYIDEKMRAYRQKLPYCALGDLTDLCERQNQRQQRIPEIFCWYLVWALGYACRRMEQEDHYIEGKTMHIVHRDMSANNIFFLDPKDVDPALRLPYAEYFPTPVLADFGAAVVTSDDDPCNPIEYTEAGTPSFKAPDQEQYLWLQVFTSACLDDRKIGPHTNIWGVGRVLYKAMGLTRWTNRVYTHPDFGVVGDREPNTGPLEEDRFQGSDAYSTELQRLLDECLSYDPAGRPSAQNIIDRAAPHLQHMNAEHPAAPWMQTAFPTVQFRKGEKLPKIDKVFGISNQLLVPESA